MKLVKMIMLGYSVLIGMNNMQEAKAQSNFQCTWTQCETSLEFGTNYPVSGLRVYVSDQMPNGKRIVGIIRAYHAFFGAGFKRVVREPLLEVKSGDIGYKFVSAASNTSLKYESLHIGNSILLSDGSKYPLSNCQRLKGNRALGQNLLESGPKSFITYSDWNQIDTLKVPDNYPLILQKNSFHTQAHLNSNL